MEDLVILEHNYLDSLFDADAFLDEDGDLRLVLTFLTDKKGQATIKTGKIRIEDISYELGLENLIKTNITIRPDKLNNLFTMETYE